MSKNFNLNPQARKVLSHLIVAGSITNVEANAIHKVRSVSKRISEIRMWMQRHTTTLIPEDIRKEMKRDVTGQRYVRYSLDHCVHKDSTVKAMQKAGLL